MNQIRLPCARRSGPFVKSTGGNYTTPVDERLGKTWPALYRFSSDIYRILFAALLSGGGHQPPFGARHPAILVFGRDDEMLLPRCDIVPGLIIGECHGGDAKSGGDQV